MAKKQPSLSDALETAYQACVRAYELAQQQNARDDIKRSAHTALFNCMLAKLWIVAPEEMMKQQPIQAPSRSSRLIEEVPAPNGQPKPPPVTAR